MQSEDVLDPSDAFSSLSSRKFFCYFRHTRTLNVPGLGTLLCGLLPLAQIAYVAAVVITYHPLQQITSPCRLDSLETLHVRYIVIRNYGNYVKSSGKLKVSV